MAYQDVTEQVEFWNKPELETGAKIEGEITIIKESTGVTRSRTAHIKTTDGTIKGIYLKRVIDDAFVQAQIVAGDKVRITYLEKKTAKNGQDFYNYKVEVDR